MPQVNKSINKIQTPRLILRSIILSSINYFIEDKSINKKGATKPPLSLGYSAFLLGIEGACNPTRPASVIGSLGTAIRNLFKSI